MSTLDFDQKKFMKEVRAFMETNKLSCRVFAKLSKVGFATLYRLESGENEITLATIRKLEKAMKDYKPCVKQSS